MLRIGKMTDYAILLMVELQSVRAQLVSAHALAERVHLEVPTVSKVLKLLSRAGLISSVRGSNGGYTLSRPGQGINMAEIIAAIEGPIAMTECSIDDGLCTQESHCTTRGNWQRISLAVASALEQVSLADMAQPIHPHLNQALKLTLVAG